MAGATMKADSATRHRVLVRGSSIAAGSGVTDNYVDMLRRRFMHRKVEIINRSRKGETSFDGVETFFVDIDPLRPDILMLHFGVDDAFGGVYRSEFKENLVRIVRLAGERFKPAVLLLTSQPFADPYDMEAVGIFYRAIREVGVDLDCRMIPVHTYWAGYLEEAGVKPAEMLQADERLPNERGHAVIAEIAAVHLEAILSAD